MTETVRPKPWPRRIAGGSAVFMVALGLTVLAGWFSHIPALIQFGSQLPPMTRNAAACSVLCGLALLMVVLRAPRWLTVVCAGIASAISILTIVEYVFGVNAGIDELLGPPYIAIRAASPGRMAPVAAMSFALGSAELLLAPGVLSKRRALLLGLNGSIIAATGMATLIAFALRSSDAFGWDHYTRASLPAAVALWVFGFGMLALAWGVETGWAGTPRWLPISAAIGVATSTVGLWQALIAQGYAPFALISAVVLGGGCLMASIFGLTVYLGQTAHTRAAALEQSEARKAAILDSALDCILTIDHEGCITEFNRAAERTFGYRRNEVVGKELADIIIPPSMREKHRRGLARYLATGDARVLGRRVEMTAVGADGREFPVELAITRIPADGPPSFTGYLRDITKRKQSEEKLRESELNLRQMTETIPEMLWSATPEGAIDYCNARVLDYTGFSVKEVMSDGWTKLLHPDDVEQTAREWTSCVTTGAPYRVEVRTFHAADRTYRWCVTSALPLLDQEGRILKWHGTVVDMHDWKQAQEELRNTQSELAHVTRVMTMGELTASIAHEVNQPLSGIITNASTCLRMLDADPPNVDGARQTAQRTIRDGHRASDVITRLRALFTKKDVTIESVDLNEAAREVIALSLTELQRNLVILRSELAHDLPLVAGDRVQVQQVILNLLRNGSDAMSDVADRPRQLIVKTERDQGDLVRLSVQDAGVGFGPQGLDKVFEPFYTTKNGGMGIGLAVSRSIIESHHGRLWATPNNGPGATFSFSIPCAAAV
jgi:PAS domain S-box-containing protein